MLVVKWIYHKRKARVIYSLATDRQPVIYWATNPLVARLYFDSYSQKPTKRQVYPSDVTSFPPLHVIPLQLYMRRSLQSNFLQWKRHLKKCWLLLLVNKTSACHGLHWLPFLDMGGRPETENGKLSLQRHPLNSKILYNVILIWLYRSKHVFFKTVNSV